MVSSWITAKVYLNGFMVLEQLLAIYPLVNVYIAIENGHRNSGFTDLPINSMVIFHSFLYVYQRVLRILSVLN